MTCKVNHKCPLFQLRNLYLGDMVRTLRRRTEAGKSAFTVGGIQRIRQLHLSASERQSHKSVTG